MLKIKNFLLLVLLGAFCSTTTFAQNKKSKPKAEKTITATSAAERLSGFEQRKKLEQESLINSVKFRNIGPSIMSGRVVDIDVNPSNSVEFYVAYASGGLWKTNNNGISFEPIFDHESSMTIGDIAVDWINNTIWVGTGENNSSRSSYAGTGLFKSIDGGKTWQNTGLYDSHHIGRIVLNPSNKNQVWVAVIGHLYTPNEERGVFKTDDGGKTWRKVLYISPNTGVIDLCLAPGNNDKLFAASWQRDRKAWNFEEGGSESGIYSSNDGGENWSLISDEKSGLPVGAEMGRIGLAAFDQKTIYCVIDNQNFKKEENKKIGMGYTKETFRNLSIERFFKLNNDTLEDYLRNNDFNRKYTAESVKNMIKNGKVKPNDLTLYVEDANSLLFDKPIIGAQVYRSDDAGKTWNKTHEQYLDGVFHTYGYYFGQIRVSPSDKNIVYLAAFIVMKSSDGGKTWTDINGENVHVDHHALWIDANNEKHLINGNDGGVNISYDAGLTWAKCNQPAVGQFYSVNYDMSRPYHVYGGLQDNGVWFGSSQSEEDNSWHQTGNYPFKSIMGGDGMQVQVDTRNNKTIYTGYQFGNYYRIENNGKTSTYITPKHSLGESPYRFNWQAPIWLSQHNQDVVYLGSNKFHRSMNKGDDFETLSDDLTNGGIKGNVPFGTLTCIHESPLRFGLIYVGSDDGNIHNSFDGGYTWNNLNQDLPKGLWVSRIQASKHELSKVVVTLNGYRNDHFKSYVYISNDYGKTWSQIGLNLPDEPINVIKEDPLNQHIYYLGTDNGLYISLNDGIDFTYMSNNLPAVAVHDLAIHPRDRELIVATHGRSIYIASIKEIQDLKPEILSENFTILDLEKVSYSRRWGSKKGSYTQGFNEPVFEIPFYSSKNALISLSIEPADSSITLYNQSFNASKGLNYLNYNLNIDSTQKMAYQDYLNIKAKNKVELKPKDSGSIYLEPGKYKGIFVLNGKENEFKFEITQRD